MTQHELLIEYLKEFKKFIPAKMSGKFYKNTIFGSECGKRARELRQKGVLYSAREGKFEVFYLKGQNSSPTNVFQSHQPLPVKSEPPKAILSPQISVSDKSNIKDINDALRAIFSTIKASWDNIDEVKDFQLALKSPYKSTKLRLIEKYTKKV